MKPESLSEIKKEIKNIGREELMEICFKLAKYKKDNKEFIHYILFESSNPFAYAEKVKDSLQESFENLSKSPYIRIKELRKLLRLVTKHIRYTSSAEIEIVLLTWFSTMMIDHADVRKSNKAMYLLFIRQIEKILKSFPKLHEDLQYDYAQPYHTMLEHAEKFITGFNKEQYLL